MVPIKENNHNFLNKLLLVNSIKKTKFKLICKLADLHSINLQKVKGIIITGSSLSLVENNEIDETYQKIMIPLILLNVPVLGICYGYEILNLLLGGTIEKMKHGEDITTNIFINKNSKIFKGYKKLKLEVKLHHYDQINKISKFLNLTSNDSKKNIMSFENEKNNIYGVQFHCEALESTHFIIDNFLDICKNNSLYSSCERNSRASSEIF